MKKLDIVFLGTLVTFFLFMTLAYTTSNGCTRLETVESKSVTQMVDPVQQNILFR
jgi:hypothetical protein